MLVFLVTSLLSSCSSFLEEKMYSNIDGRDMYSNYESADLAVMGIYSALTNNSSFGLTWPCVTTYGTDEARCYFEGTGINDLFFRQSNYSHTAGDVKNLDMWNTIYSGIKSANDVYHKVEKMNISRDEKNTLQSEALFLRSYFYFSLVQLWGGVALEIDEPSSEIVQSRKVKRATVQQVYEQVVSDIEFAKKYLPEQQDPGYEGRVTKYAAYGMAAKIYLTMASGSRFGVAGYEFFNPQEYYKLAKDNAEEVIFRSNGKFELQHDYGQIFSMENKHNSEILFEANFCVGGPGSYYPKQGGPLMAGNTDTQKYYYGNYGETGRGYLRPSVYLSLGVYGSEVTVDATKGDVTAITSDDVRFEHNIAPAALFSVDSYGNRTWASLRANPEQWVAYKFSLRTDIMSGYTWTSTPMNFPILRYADVLLIHTEACGMLDRSNSSSYYGINEVRKRARREGTDPDYLQDYTPADFSTEKDFMDAIMDERMRELCFEGHRRFDLLRTSRLFYAINRMKETDEALSFEYGDGSGKLSKNAIKTDITIQHFDVAIKPYHILFPIPQYEMNIVEGPDYQQNPGWASAIE